MIRGQRWWLSLTRLSAPAEVNGFIGSLVTGAYIHPLVITKEGKQWLFKTQLHNTSRSLVCFVPSTRCRSLRAGWLRSSQRPALSERSESMGRLFGLTLIEPIHSACGLNRGLSYGRLRPDYSRRRLLRIPCSDTTSVGRDESSRASTNSSALNGRRSSRPSPTPI